MSAVKGNYYQTVHFSLKRGNSGELCLIRENSPILENETMEVTKKIAHFVTGMNWISPKKVDTVKHKVLHRIPELFRRAVSIGQWFKASFLILTVPLVIRTMVDLELSGHSTSIIIIPKSNFQNHIAIFWRSSKCMMSWLD